MCNFEYARMCACACMSVLANAPACRCVCVYVSVTACACVRLRVCASRFESSAFESSVGVFESCASVGKSSVSALPLALTLKQLHSHEVTLEHTHILARTCT